MTWNHQDLRDLRTDEEDSEPEETANVPEEVVYAKVKKSTIYPPHRLDRPSGLYPDVTVERGSANETSDSQSLERRRSVEGTEDETRRSSLGKQSQVDQLSMESELDAEIAPEPRKRRRPSKKQRRGGDRNVCFRPPVVSVGEEDGNERRKCRQSHKQMHRSLGNETIGSPSRIAERESTPYSRRKNYPYLKQEASPLKQMVLTIPLMMDKRSTDIASDSSSLSSEVFKPKDPNGVQDLETYSDVAIDDTDTDTDADISANTDTGPAAANSDTTTDEDTDIATDTKEELCRFQETDLTNQTNRDFLEADFQEQGFVNEEENHNDEKEKLKYTFERLSHLKSGGHSDFEKCTSFNNRELSLKQLDFPSLTQVPRANDESGFAINENAIMSSFDWPVLYWATSLIRGAPERGEIKLREGEVVQVTRKEANGWWFVKNNDKAGWAPSNFLQKVLDGDVLKSNYAYPDVSTKDLGTTKEVPNAMNNVPDVKSPRNRECTNGVLRLCGEEEVEILAEDGRGYVFVIVAERFGWIPKESVDSMTNNRPS